MSTIPAAFLQEIEYDAPESLETNRQQIASDPRVQAYIMGWKAMFPAPSRSTFIKSSKTRRRAPGPEPDARRDVFVWDRAPYIVGRMAMSRTPLTPLICTEGVALPVARSTLCSQSPDISQASFLP